MAVTMHDISTTVRLNQEVPLIIGQLLGVTPVAIGANPAQWRLSLECKVSKYHCRVEQKSPYHPKNVELGNWLDTNPRGVIGSTICITKTILTFAKASTGLLNITMTDESQYRFRVVDDLSALLADVHFLHNFTATFRLDNSFSRIKWVVMKVGKLTKSSTTVPYETLKYVFNPSQGPTSVQFLESHIVSPEHIPKEGDIVLVTAMRFVTQAQLRNQLLLVPTASTMVMDEHFIPEPWLAGLSSHKQDASLFTPTDLDHALEAYDLGTPSHTPARLTPPVLPAIGSPPPFHRPAIEGSPKSDVKIPTQSTSTLAVAHGKPVAEDPTKEVCDECANLRVCKPDPTSSNGFRCARYCDECWSRWTAQKSQKRVAEKPATMVPVCEYSGDLKGMEVYVKETVRSRSYADGPYKVVRRTPKRVVYIENGEERFKPIEWCAVKVDLPKKDT